MLDHEKTFYILHIETSFHETISWTLIIIPFLYYSVAIWDLLLRILKMSSYSGNDGLNDRDLIGMIKNCMLQDTVNDQQIIY